VLAKLLILTPRRVQQLIDEGVLRRARDEDGNELRGRFHWIECVQSYIRYLRSRLESGDLTETKFLDARSRRMTAQAQMAELRLAALKGTYHRAEDVEFLMTQRDSAIKAQILALPSRVARLLVGKTDFQEIYNLLMAEVVALLENLSGYDPRAFTKANEEYLARLFPEAPAAVKPNGSGKGESEAEAIETDVE
jgi:phage terminase Nu1 subunit (DNA packaging protein)